MKPLAYASLIPALLLFGACGSTPSESDTDSGSDTGSSGSETSSDPDTTANPTTGATAGNACVPGQQIACACENGLDGAQTCKLDGTGYDPCVCSGADSGSSDPVTSDPATSAGPTSDPGTTDAESTSDVSGGTSTGGDSSTSGDPSGESSTGGESTGGDQPYGPCPNGDGDCLDNEQCVQGMNMMMGPWTICVPGECDNEGDCDTIPDDICNDAPGDGEAVDYCLPAECDDNTPCPNGMECFAPNMGFGTSVCLWPD